MTATKARIIAQLRENTGAHFLDSGGAYGRGWERWGKVTDEAANAKPAAYVTDDFIQINTVEWPANRDGYSVDGDDAPTVENGVVTCPCGETMGIYMREVY